ncbi:dnaJ homolog subfamily C member 2 [Adelges cooleyi]|uniref:dnaJ homolog subfamily C member 2 n=1 Tax=Adelges cooleyi TaxID=133065 RepID=UPI00217F5E5F|nr:dnaJ homolog subfamily C member 2 [Adelges cooleyi]XP_050419897.1 dnaJ homolog subfamily C member 2 [Adelges cooleyi]
MKDKEKPPIFDVQLRKVETVGPWILTLLSGSTVQDKSLANGDEIEDTDFSFIEESESDTIYLKTLDPKEWKDQDHYRVLGLSELRFKATEAQIKTAYRRRVLNHHPDKRKKLGEKVQGDDDYFTCITRAWEILGNKLKRRAFDSIDPKFDNDIPSKDTAKKSNFFELFGPVFARNSIWSEQNSVPQLGDINSSRDHVDRFYNFWYSFNSWREFSYLDEEDREQATDREERRWIEKQNRANRAKLKKEESTRIRQLVDLAYANDPRLLKFKKEEQERKAALKQAKKDAIRQKQEEEIRQREEEAAKAQKEKEEREAAEKAQRNALKAEKESQKKALKKERKHIRDLCNTNNYYIQNGDNVIEIMSGVEKICDQLSVDQLKQLAAALQKEGRKALIEKLKQMECRVEMNNVIKNEVKVVENNNNNWETEDVQLLIKAVNLFPAGTNQRWEAVANFINQHSKIGGRNAKQVLAKAKSMQNANFTDNALKSEMNANAYDQFEKQKKCEANMPEEVSERQAGWSAEEQKLLEQALKTYPVAIKDRWDRIAECVPTRTKKECMKRFKEIVELVKAKKAAQV